jgi:hypothetical protein
LPGDVTINVHPSLGESQIIYLKPGPTNWADPSIYAPALPGVIVAILGLWIAHRLSMRRERRSEVLRLCDAVKGAAADTVAICTKAWMAAPGDERNGLIQEAKSRLQTLGSMATNLRRRSGVGTLRTVKSLFVDGPISIDVLGEIAAMRDLATGDPFEDPTRDSDASRVNDMRAKIANIDASIDMHFFKIFG